MILYIVQFRPQKRRQHEGHPLWNLFCLQAQEVDTREFTEIIKFHETWISLIDTSVSSYD